MPNIVNSREIQNLPKLKCQDYISFITINFTEEEKICGRQQIKGIIYPYININPHAFVKISVISLCFI